jgi:2-keto-4-pentenoate hydratase/2-oxohepta-3-ene-1,7-dioic acid hydratase in catechol pathway
MVFIGRNYLEHAREMGNDMPTEPMLFLKPPSSVIRGGEPIVLHGVSTHIEFEGEIGVMVGRTLTKATVTEAQDAVSHIVAVNDVTARDLQKSDGQWARAKGMDTFCPVGEKAPAPSDLSSLRVVTTVNGVVCQQGSATDMAFSIPTVLSYISQFITLEPGDLVATGTPSGTKKLAAGDTVIVEVFSADRLLSRVSNPVIAGT